MKIQIIHTKNDSSTYHAEISDDEGIPMWRDEFKGVWINCEDMLDIVLTAVKNNKTIIVHDS